MSYRWETCAAIASERMLAIVRADSAEQAHATGTTLIKAGIEVLEVALTTPGALDVIRALDAEAGERIVGAGTVLDAESARLAVLAGARFLVSPSVRPAVIEMGHRYGAAVLAGAQTPTEIEQALTAGSDMIKLFPAEHLGPSYLMAVRAALPQLPAVPTGGVDAANAASWLRAGAVAVAAGGSLSGGNPDQVRAQASELLDAVRGA